MSNCLSLSFRL